MSLPSSLPARSPRARRAARVAVAAIGLATAGAALTACDGSPVASDGAGFAYYARQSCAGAASDTYRAGSMGGNAAHDAYASGTPTAIAHARTVGEYRVVELRDGAYMIICPLL